MCNRRKCLWQATKSEHLYQYKTIQIILNSQVKLVQYFKFFLFETEQVINTAH